MAQFTETDAEKNLTAMHAAPRLCQIYLRDTFSLLSRRDLDTCRLISLHSNAAFLRYPTMSWPRYDAHRLDLDVVSQLIVPYTSSVISPTHSSIRISPN